MKRTRRRTRITLPESLDKLLVLYTAAIRMSERAKGNDVSHINVAQVVAGIVALFLQENQEFVLQEYEEALAEQRKFEFPGSSAADDIKSLQAAFDDQVPQLLRDLATAASKGKPVDPI